MLLTRTINPLYHIYLIIVGKVWGGGGYVFGSNTFSYFFPNNNNQLIWQAIESHITSLNECFACWIVKNMFSFIFLTVLK